MKYIFLSLLIGINLSSNAQQKDSTTYRLVVHFNSICCGVPDSKPLDNAIKSFKKAKRFRAISATHIGPMGREGEYMLAFTLKGMSATQKKAFINKIKQTTLKMIDKGNASVEENEIIIKSNLPATTTFEKKYY